MVREYGSSVIAVFLLFLVIVLPVGAADVLPAITVAANQTANITVTTNVTTVPATTTVPLTTVTTTQTTNVTPTQTNATVKKTPTPRKTTVPTTSPAPVATTVNATIPVLETPATGSAMVYSSPTGANILIDGVYMGTTPGNIVDVPAGNHILRLSLSGYYDYEGSLYVVPGQTAQGYGTLQPLNRVATGAPTPVPTVIIPVIVPVATATTDSNQAGLLGNSGVVVAIIGAISVVIAAGASVFTHIKPPKKE